MVSYKSISQFFKDGLVGVAVALPPSIALLLLLLGMFWSDLDDVSLLYEFLLAMFFRAETVLGFVPGPMLLGLLIAFFSSAKNGQILESVTSREEWTAAIRRIAGSSFFLGIGLILIQYPFVFFDDLVEIFKDLFGNISDLVEMIMLFVTPVAFFVGLSAVIGFWISKQLGIRLQPQKRLHRMALGAIPCGLIGCGAGIVQFLLIWSLFGGM